MLKYEFNYVIFVNAWKLSLIPIVVTKTFRKMYNFGILKGFLNNLSNILKLG